MDRTAHGSAGTRTVRRAAVAATMTLAATVTIAACSASEPDEPAEASATASGTVVADAAALLPAEVSERGTLRMLGDFSYPPFVYLDGEEMAGLDFELGNEIAARLGLTPEWSLSGGFANLVPGVQNGRADAALNSINITPERLEQVSFVAYLSSFDVAIVPAGNPADVDPANLCGVSFAVTVGGASNPLLEAYSEDCVAEGLDPITLTEFADTNAALLAVSNGRLDGMSVGYATATYQAQQSGGALEVLDAVTLLGSDERMRQADVGIAVSKDAGLGEALTAALTAIQDDGTFAEILDHYGFDDTSVVPAALHE